MATLKRFVSLLLCIILVFATVPMVTYAADDGVVIADDTPTITTYDDFLYKLYVLEMVASEYINMYPGNDPVELIIKYIRTGVDRYNSGSWNIMAGYEDPQFAEFVIMVEDILNAELPEEEKISIASLKNIDCFYLPNGDYVDIGHMFGTMDITYHNYTSQNHADVGGWAGDLTDLLSVTDAYGVEGTLDEMIEEISENYLFKEKNQLEVDGQFSKTDFLGDLDALYIMQKLDPKTYELDTENSFFYIFSEYFTEELTELDRVEFFLENRIGSTGTRQNIRDIIYNEYTSNKVISTLEGTREYQSKDINTLRKACCYAFADYVCKLAGDYVDDLNNPFFNVFESESSNLAPGITQEIRKATSADNKQMVYYLSTVDITREDVNIYANYNNNDPTKWQMSRVLDQANAAQKKYGDPESEHYIENYNVISSINGAGYDMTTGEPGGLLVMGGVEYHPVNSNGFFGILDDGTAVIGSTNEYNTIYKDRVKEGIAGFGATLVKNGKIVVSPDYNYFGERASRTAIGITKTGKVVFMVLDGRQEPVSCGGSTIEIAQIMLDAGCVNAVNLDGGGSSTYVAKQVGDSELSVVNKPSDGAPRSVSASLMAVSTAPSSTKFDHAELESEYDYLTVGTSIQLNPMGVSATGNKVDMPEGFTWEVADSRFGTITQEGVFTGKREGSVDVRLVLDNTVIGSKTVHIVAPDNVYFTKTNITAVYGSTVELPVVALFMNKPVAVKAGDIVFSLSNDKAGTFEGINFNVTSTATNLKVINVTATLANDESITASITINLFNQGEVTFDFENCTGGNRMLAWQRDVSNSTTDDTINYKIVDTNKDMVTSYAVAIDMTTIPIPPILQDLVYMLPGGDLADSTAWTFLCQLAERVSVLTEVKATLDFDDNVNVDYSDIRIINDYFSLSKTEFDESTNKLTVTLNWIDQTKAIDIDSANPICIVNGIKITPKADAEITNGRITIENTGNISYKVYLRASQLYSFSSKPENQETFQLYPFVNPDNTAEKGGYFTNTYAEFFDTYNLIKTVKNGWINENGGFAYYVDGTKLTGIQKIDGYYYDLGEFGINDGQTKFTGVFFDEDTGVYRYSKLGELASGWQMIGTDWYYYLSDYSAANGRVKVNGIYFDFNKNGKLVSGRWVNAFTGYRYYYGPDYYRNSWTEIDGEMYYFKNSYRITGNQYLHSIENKAKKLWYSFDDEGKCLGLCNGLLTDTNGILHYFVDGVNKSGLYKIDGDYYLFGDNGAFYDQKVYAWETHCDLPCANYTFGKDGKALNGLVEKDGATYYYENGRTGKTVGLTKIDGNYYFVDYDGKCLTGKQYAWATNCDLPVGHYYFAENGVMLDGFVAMDDATYYYENGRTGKTVGLTKIDGDYYFIDYDGKCLTGKQYAWATNCDLPKDNYEFAPDGKMYNGVVRKEDGKYYSYKNGKMSRDVGLTKVGDDYYFFDYGVCITGNYYAWATNCDLPKAHYEFGEDGKMLQGIVEKADGLYYYVNGKPGREYGLLNIDGDYYFVLMDGQIITNRIYYAWDTKCDLPKANYEFGADGKMLQGIVQKNGEYYYYVDGKAGREYGFLNIDGDYYFVLMNGKVISGTKYYVWETKCDLPVGNYEFGADGKLLQGVVEKADGLYYYTNGNVGKKYGLIKDNDSYYFVLADGKIVTDSKYYAWATNCDLPVGHYYFGEDGKILDGFVTRPDGIYYYENGVVGKVGINYIDGYYYFIDYNGYVITNKTAYAWQGNDILVEKNYVFNEYGQIIG